MRALLGVLFAVLPGLSHAQAVDGELAQPMHIEPFEASDTGPSQPMKVEAFEASDAGPSQPMQLEAFDLADAGPAGAPTRLGSVVASALEAATVKLYGFASATASLDTRFDSPRGAPLGENVAEGWVHTLVGLDARLNAHVRVVIEGRAQVRLTTQRDFDRAKGFFEPMLGDAYVDLYSPAVDLRVGNQRITLGANASLAPADLLNPRDLRESFLSGEPENAVLPVFALRAQGQVLGFSWLAAYAPFFTPSRYTLFGQDESLLQPGLGPALDTSRVDPSVEDQLQEHLLETKRPPPFLGDVALRVRREGRLKLGASWVWANEKLPRFRLDPQLASVLAAQAAGKPIDLATGLSVLDRFEARQMLATGTYARTHVFSLEASTLLGPGQLDVDLAYSPRATFLDAGFNPIDKASVTWVVSFSQAAQSSFVWSLSYLGLAVPGVGAKEQLLLIEPASAAGAPRTVFLHVLSGYVSVPIIHDVLEVSLRGAFEPVQLSFAAGPRLTWLAFDALKVWVAAEIYQGAVWSPFGYFGRNGKVLIGARFDL